MSKLIAELREAQYFANDHDYLLDMASRAANEIERMEKALRLAKNEFAMQGITQMYDDPSVIATLTAIDEALAP